MYFALYSQKYEHWFPLYSIYVIDDVIPGKVVGVLGNMNTSLLYTLTSVSIPMWSSSEGRKPSKENIIHIQSFCHYDFLFNFAKNNLLNLNIFYFIYIIVKIWRILQIIDGFRFIFIKKINQYFLLITILLFSTGFEGLSLLRFWQIWKNILSHWYCDSDIWHLTVPVFKLKFLPCGLKF